MRSYYEHLNSATLQEPLFQGVFRASSLFPAIQDEGINTRVLFMGYWMVKRDIKEIGSVVTIRDQEGYIVKRKYEKITQAKAYKYDVKELIETNIPFKGSIEVEFFSSQNLVFPYPAVIINYYGPKFSTFVHTAERVYNNFEDLERNGQVQVKEAGFNIYYSENMTPFTAFVNGPVPEKDMQLECEFFNDAGESTTRTFHYDLVKPYEMCEIPYQKWPELKNFFGPNPGTCKLKFNLDWVFPRIIAGNKSSLPALSVTHTYYDTTHANSDKDFWKKADEGYFPASLFVPIDTRENYFTHLYIYPIYSNSPFSLIIEYFNEMGKKIFEKTLENVHNGFIKLELSEWVKDHPKSRYGAKISALNQDKIPARIKVGYDLGYLNPEMPCNLCTNLAPYNPKLTTKKTSFKWAPFLADQMKPEIWLMNSSPQISFEEPAQVEITFYREKDNSVHIKEVILPPHGFYVIEMDPELEQFFAGGSGWATFRSTNPYLYTYYFSINPSGVVGGDHGF